MILQNIAVRPFRGRESLPRYALLTGVDAISLATRPEPSNASLHLDRDPAEAAGRNMLTQPHSLTASPLVPGSCQTGKIFTAL